MQTAFPLNNSHLKYKYQYQSWRKKSKEKECFWANVLLNRRSPHGTEVPASNGCVVCCGELAAVVVRAPFSGGELELAFALQCGGA